MEEGSFDVLKGRTNFTIKMNDHFCDIQKWQINDFPCKHTARGILGMNIGYMNSVLSGSLLKSIENYMMQSFT